MNNQRPHVMERVYRNWCQSAASALMPMVTLWKSREWFVPKIVYLVSVLLLKNILVWRNVLYFMDDLRNFYYQLCYFSSHYFPILLQKLFCPSTHSLVKSVLISLSNIVIYHQIYHDITNIEKLPTCTLYRNLTLLYDI